MYFLFNRTTLQVFVTYLTGALYVHPLWFYKHQHDNGVRSKQSVACQRWWFQWRFWFVPSVSGYLHEEEEHKPDPWRNPTERNHRGLHLENEWQAVKTPTIISNNPVHIWQQLNMLYIVLILLTLWIWQSAVPLLRIKFKRWLTWLILLKAYQHTVPLGKGEGCFKEHDNFALP